MIAHALRDQNLNGSTPLAKLEGITLCRLFSEMSIAMEHGATLMLVGETGTGKTFLSRLLHQTIESPCKRFLCLNCGVLTTEQVEQQMFARLNHQHHDSSTLILIREIETLSWPQQMKLLNRIDGETCHDSNLNTDRTPRPQFIVSCQQDLLSSVKQGTFRSDLYYRLNTHRFELPPLRNRLDEITGLTRQFIRLYSRQFNKRVDRIEDSMMQRLMAYSWPGNIRELKHVIERAVMYCDTGILNDSHLPETLKPVEQPGNIEAFNMPEEKKVIPFTAAGDLTLEEQLANTERQLVEQALIRNQQCRTDAARELGVSRVTLYNKMKKLGLETLKPIE